MTIEQDCLALERGYGRVADSALLRVAESGALLDEARLSADFDKNSDSAARGLRFLFRGRREIH